MAEISSTSFSVVIVYSNLHPFGMSYFQRLFIEYFLIYSAGISLFGTCIPANAFNLKSLTAFIIAFLTKSSSGRELKLSSSFLEINFTLEGLFIHQSPFFLIIFLQALDSKYNQIFPSYPLLSCLYPEDNLRL